MKATHPFNETIALMRRLPTFGNRSAQRVLLHLTENKKLLKEMISALHIIDENAQRCDICCNIDVENPCYICRDERRSDAIICIVQDVNALWAMEKAHAFKGKYHVLGGLLSAINNVTPASLPIEQLLHRIADKSVKEIIIGIGATLDGQVTSHYISNTISKNNQDIKISKIAFGIPMGGDLDYMDESTLKVALEMRTNITSV
ncbi:Recombination protein RecR [Candidatus Fokinia solitaria]|uniref:Recombination protein RecR n=1 Tax=Candidatus Fokinia solitaria TaxID=1802984 RepID=A0A2U8BSZ6_9RICK|nr:recombination mediator RecR [Candidatus Fokinia solitaria]AWD33469.1 Recombination protein RecR [Candidatus Fokinia solitaria]